MCLYSFHRGNGPKTISGPPKRPLFPILFALLTLLPRSTNSLVVVQPIKSPSSSDDVFALADLRYEEWIQDAFPDTSRHGFRLATAELYDERQSQGAIVFLAKQRSSPEQRPIAVGAAELSPIELQGVYTGTNDKEGASCLYVTDVVTAKQYRRQGIAKALMEAVEEHARSKQKCTQLLLHVEASNTAALHFYRKLGYDQVVQEGMEGLDLDVLADNACTQGQLLLCKRLPLQNDPRQKRGRSRAARGFVTATKR